MITLDDPRWSQLSHAYGNAVDLPDLLRQAGLLAERRAGADSKESVVLWARLWSCLCHQESVFDASYAAVPHLIELALGKPRPADRNFRQLPVAIERARLAGAGPAIPEDLKAGYFAAIERLPQFRPKPPGRA